MKPTINYYLLYVCMCTEAFRILYSQKLLKAPILRILRFFTLKSLSSNFCQEPRNGSYQDER